MYLLDTNHCSLLIQNNPTVSLRMIQVGALRISTCVIVQGELIYMAENSERKANNLAFVGRFLEGIYVYDVDGLTANIYGQLRAALVQRFGPKERSKRRRVRTRDFGIDENDLWIASIALQHNLTLVSADRDFQRLQEVRSLSVETWYSPSEN